MIADDLFAGAGGWDVAAQRLGIEARGVENMKEARATRDAAGLTTIHDDVWTFEPDGNASGLIASPPCQTFSQAGKGNGRKALDLVLAAVTHGSWKNIEELRAHLIGPHAPALRLCHPARVDRLRAGAHGPPRVGDVRRCARGPRLLGLDRQPPGGDVRRAADAQARVPAGLPHPRGGAPDTHPLAVSQPLPGEAGRGRQEVGQHG